MTLYFKIFFWDMRQYIFTFISKVLPIYFIIIIMTFHFTFIAALCLALAVFLCTGISLARVLSVGLRRVPHHLALRFAQCFFLLFAIRELFSGALRAPKTHNF